MPADDKILSGLTAINTLSPLVIALIGTLRAGDTRTDDEIMAAARAKVAETKAITEEDMGNQP